MNRRWSRRCCRIRRNQCGTTGCTHLPGLEAKSCVRAPDHSQRSLADGREHLETQNVQPRGSGSVPRAWWAGCITSPLVTLCLGLTKRHVIACRMIAIRCAFRLGYILGERERSSHVGARWSLLPRRGCLGPPRRQVLPLSRFSDFVCEIHAKFRSRSQRYGTVGTNLISVLRTALTEYLIRSAPYHPQAANTRGARGCLARSGVLGLHDRTEVRRLDADRPPGFVNTSSSSSTSSSVTVLDIRIASRCARGVRRELSRREQMLFTPSSTRRRQEVCAKSASW